MDGQFTACNAQTLREYAISSHLLFIPCQPATSITRDNDHAQRTTQTIDSAKTETSKKRKLNETVAESAIRSVIVLRHGTHFAGNEFGISILWKAQKSTSIRWYGFALSFARFFASYCHDSWFVLTLWLQHPYSVRINISIRSSCPPPAGCQRFDVNGALFTSTFGVRSPQWIEPPNVTKQTLDCAWVVIAFSMFNRHLAVSVEHNCRTDVAWIGRARCPNSVRRYSSVSERPFSRSPPHLNNN